MSIQEKDFLDMDLNNPRTIEESVENIDFLDFDLNMESGTQIPPTPEKNEGTPIPETKENLSSEISGKGFTNISVPQSAEISVDVYNDAIKNIHKSFKEMTNVLDVLSNATIVEKSTDQRQEEYVQQLLEQTESEAWLNGPIFEAVKDPDKNEIRDEVKGIRNKIKTAVKENDKDIKGKTWAVVAPKGYNKMFSWRSIAVILNDGAKAPKAALDSLKKFIDTDEYELRTSLIYDQEGQNMSKKDWLLSVITFGISDVVNNFRDGTQRCYAEVVELYKKEDSKKKDQDDEK